MYGKAFVSMYEGSMVGAGCAVFAVWNYAIAKNRMGVVELNPKLLAFILGGSEKEITDALAYLCAADSQSRSGAEGGRRLVKEGQFQYRMVNWDLYDKIKSAEGLREYNARKQAEYRARNKLKAGKPLKGESETLHRLNNGEISQEQADDRASLTRERK
jgi:hypothetical protein